MVELVKENWLRAELQATSPQYIADITDDCFWDILMCLPLLPFSVFLDMLLQCSHLSPLSRSESIRSVTQVFCIVRFLRNVVEGLLQVRFAFPRGNIHHQFNALICLFSPSSAYDLAGNCFICWHLFSVMIVKRLVRISCVLDSSVTTYSISSIKFYIAISLRLIIFCLLFICFFVYFFVSFYLFFWNSCIIRFSDGT